MARGGFRPGAGCKKGSRASKEIKAMAEALKSADPATVSFKTAKEFAMWVINNDPDMENRLRAMQAVLPYTDAKVAEVAPGKKEQANIAAQTADAGTEWESLLSGKPN